MKTILTLMIIGSWFSLGPMQDTDIHGAALAAIGQARAAAPAGAEATEQLTPAEKHALGRYLETPQLEEVYPGLRGTAPSPRR